MADPPPDSAYTRELVQAALFCALGVATPLLFHALPGAGPLLLPMHLPVLLVGFVVRPSLALAVGFLTPWVSWQATGMPPFPFTVPMSVELAVLGGVAALAARRCRWIWLAATIAVAARCGATFALGSLLATPLGLPSQASAWVAVVQGLPGAALQLALTPAIVPRLQRALARQGGA